VTPQSPGPAVVCFPGSFRSKEQLAGEPELHPNYAFPRREEQNQRARLYAESGIVSVAVDTLGFGETSDGVDRAREPQTYDLTAISRYLTELGRPHAGLAAQRDRELLKWLRGLDYVDSSRIALSGHSLGTSCVLVSGVLDPGIHALVFNDYLCPKIERAIAVTKVHTNDIRNYAPGGFFPQVPGTWEWFDFPDLAAALAPRPLLLTEGGPEHSLDVVRRAYAILGASDRLSIHHYPKYAEPDARRDGQKIPEGIDGEEWLAWANVDKPQHFFKGDLAVPWLIRCAAQDRP
jgi:hypothetical protein